jgi:heme-degrading monooxygenase HmoA
MSGTKRAGVIDMSEPALVLLVRFKCPLTLEEVMKVVEDRAPEFRALAGLQQKYYLQDAATGEYAGLYLWDSPEAVAAYRESELRATIARAYQAEGEPRVEVYRVFKTLRDEAE